jgi:Fe-S-cluster containining protein
MTRLRLVDAFQKINSTYGDVCKECDYPCCIGRDEYDSPCVTPEDVQRLADYLHMRNRTFIKKYVLPREALIGSQREFPSLKHPCPFYKNHRCSLYTIRPLICRIFPFNVHPDGIILDGMPKCKLACLIEHDYNRLFNRQVTMTINSPELNQTNKERAKQGLPPLKRHDQYYFFIPTDNFVKFYEWKMNKEQEMR